MSLILRKIESSDHLAWHRLWNAYLTFYETSLRETVYAATFARLTGDDPRFFGFLAVQDGQPVGLAHCICDESFWSPEGRVYLQDLYADPAVRGTGVGRALIEAVYVEADKIGRPQVWWLTQEFNATARKLYDRIGIKSPFIKYNRPA
jgi:GNAT superfamily N-acetyltransferase